MVRITKRSKRSRLRGAKTCGYGFRKKHKGGKGEHGGRGMAGSGKRAGQKITWIQRYHPNYFGKRGFHSKKKNLKVINLDEIEERMHKFLEKKIAKKTSKGIELKLKDYKILGRGELKEKLIIEAAAFSKEATEKIKKAGGELIKKETGDEEEIVKEANIEEES